MTLIISCITEDHCIQISDRKLTFPSGITADDNSNKSTLVKSDGILSFAYTGIAHIGNKKSDLWFISSISQSKFRRNELLDDVSNECTKIFSTINTKKDLKRLAFVGVGYIFVKQDTEHKLIPIYIIISNFHDNKGKWTNEIYDTFKPTIIIPNKTSNYSLFIAGQNLPRDVKRTLDRDLKKCLNKTNDPFSLSRIIIKSIRAVADKNSYVGKDLLLTSIPKKAVKNNGFIALSSKPNNKEITFCYVPLVKKEWISYGPNFAEPGGWATSNFKIRYLDTNKESKSDYEVEVKLNNVKK